MKNDEFDWIFYVNYYNDLKNRGINTEEEALKHWKSYGIQEKRICNRYQINKINQINQNYQNYQNYQNNKIIFNLSTPIFYINLNDNIERNNNMINLVKKFKFKNVTRIEAIDTRKNIENFKNSLTPYAYKTLLNNTKRGQRNYHRELTNGGIGCYLSHTNIYKKIVEDNIPYAVVLEDDVQFLDPEYIFWKKINLFNIPNDTDIFIFEAIIFDYKRISNIGKVNFFWQTSFYLITNIGAKKILNYISPIEFQIDAKLSMLSYANKINVYGQNNCKFVRLNFPSNIQSLNTKSNMITEIAYMKKQIDKGLEIK